MTPSAVIQASDALASQRAYRAYWSRLVSCQSPEQVPQHTQGTDGPIRAAVDVTVEPLTDTSSRLTITVDFDGHGIGKLLVPLSGRRQAQKEMPANVKALKQRVQAQQAQHPA